MNYLRNSVLAIALAASASNIAKAQTPALTPPGIVAWWQGEGNFIDRASGLNGTGSGVTFSAGKVNSAFSFDGNSEITIPNDPKLNLESFTIEAWIYPTVLDGEVNVIVSKENEAKLPLQYEIGIRGNEFPNGAVPLGHLVFYIDSVQGLPSDYLGWADGGGFVPLNEWTHVALSFSGTNAVTYTNGIEARAISNLAGIPQDSGGPFKIGSRSAQAISERPDDRFKGEIDEVSVYDHALTPSEINSIFRAGMFGKSFFSVENIPIDTIVTAGDSVYFAPVIRSSGAIALQWFFENQVLPNETNAILSLSNVEVTAQGIYSLRVADATTTNEAVKVKLTVLSPSCIPAPDGLIAWWTGDGNARDTVSGFNGTLSGTVEFVDGRIGKSFSFDGSSEVIIPAFPQLNPQSLTIEAWVYPLNRDGEVDIIFDKESVDKSILQYELGIRGTEFGGGQVDPGNLVFYIGGLSGLPNDYLGWVDGGGSVPLNTWTHVALTFDGSTVRTYVNAVQKRTITGLSGTIPDSGGPVKIGSRSDQALRERPQDRFVGNIDEVSFYNRALTASEIAKIYADPEGKCKAGFPPAITQQPLSQTVKDQSNLTLTATVGGSEPLTFQWQKDGTEIEGAKDVSITLANIQLSDAGSYVLVAQNPFGTNSSSSAKIVVRLADHIPPDIAILSPSGATLEDERIILRGTASDNVGVAAANWSRDEGPPAALDIIDGSFQVPGLVLHRGTNLFKVLAADPDGNIGSAEAAVLWDPPRILSIGVVEPASEGSHVAVPIQLINRGGVGGLTFNLTYSSAFLQEPDLEWSPNLGDSFRNVNYVSPGSIRAAFALPGTELPLGTNTIAILRFRARTVPNTISTELRPTIVAISNSRGDAIDFGNDSQNGTATILRRKYIGDNNGNDQLDVSDASIIMRFITQLDVARPWDISGNDLNSNLQLDTGDVTRVLRAVVGLDPQPNENRSLRRAALNSNTGSVVLTSDNLQPGPGQPFSLKIDLKDNTAPVSGVSFQLNYPTNALRLINSTGLKTGAITPAGSLAVWLVSPTNNYEAQDGLAALAVSSPSSWTANNGTVAEIEFQVQDTSINQYLWPITISRVRVGSGYDLINLPGASINFIGRNAVPPLFNPVVELDETNVSLKVSSEIGVTYALDYSADLRSWIEISRQTAVANVTVFSDAQASLTPFRFYRIRQLP